MYDLLIKGGTVVDPSQDLHAVRDVALRDGLVATVDTSIDGPATETIDATGLIVSPGLMDLRAPDGAVYQAGTLSGNPLSMAAGIAALRELRDDPPYERLERLGAEFSAAIAGLDRDGVQLQRVGSIAWLYLAADELPRRADGIDPAAVDRFGALHRPLLERGHYLPPSAYEVLFLSAAHGTAQIERLVADLSALLETMDS